MSEKELERMTKAFTGVSLADTWPELGSSTRLVDKNRPPSYLVKAALEKVFKHRLPRGHEKAAWAAPLTYKGVTFEVCDWKRSRWNIFGQPGFTEAAEELAQKISAASAILDHHLKQHCRGLLKQEKFSLDNQYHRCRALFEYFRAQCLARLADPENNDQPKASDPEALTASLNSWFQNSMELNGYLLATSIFFFSLTEVIFDACFALGDRDGRTYREFRSQAWEERFKQLLPPREHEIQTTHNGLLELRRLYRNTPVHASPLYCFDVPGVGLIPATASALDNPNNQPLFAMDESNAASLLGTLVSALDLFESHPYTEFGFAYAESGLTIHLKEEQLTKHRENMNSIDTYRSFLQDSLEYLDALTNMEI
ncbi:MAG: hypothetical protein AAGD06_17245 [Acidobacteriota bacterium]